MIYCRDPQVMEALALDVTSLGEEGAQMITLVETASLEDDATQHNVHILTANQVGKFYFYE